MSLATKLKALRLKKGESLQDVGDAVSVSKAHIWELEKGTATNPGVELLKKLGDHFGVTVEYLVTDDAKVEEAMERSFFRHFEGKLSEKDWDTIRTVAESLSGKQKK